MNAHAEEKSPGWIDAHSHIWSPDLKTWPLAEAERKTAMQPASFTAEQLLQLAGKHGVEKVVLIQHIFLHGYDNSYLIHARNTHPGRFAIVGAVDQEQPDPGLKMRELKQRGVKGFRLKPQTKNVDRWLDGESMQAIWKTAGEEQLVLGLLLQPDGLPAVDRMCARWPDSPIVIDHFGRVGFNGAVKETELKSLLKLARHKNVSVKVSAFYGFGDRKPPYRDAIPLIKKVHETFGASRLMWASDCPYQNQKPHSYAASLELVTKRLDFLSHEDRQWLLRNTAKKVFFE